MQFTIVTPTLNRCAMLREALGSIDAQRVPGIEIIVVDGGSDDGTLEMLSERGDVTVVQDRRLGLYDAVNMGMARATGDIIGWLNSDDLYHAGALAAVRHGFEDDPAADSVCGRAELFDSSGVVESYDDPRDRALDYHTALVGSAIINARFFRKDILARVGAFDSSYRFVADREFLVRMLDAGARTTAIDALVCRYRQHEGSLTFAESGREARPLRLELLRLARAIGGSPTSSTAAKRKAVALEGRCIARLVAEEMGTGDWAAGARTLLMRDGAFYPGGPAAVMRALLDRPGPR